MCKINYMFNNYRLFKNIFFFTILTNYCFITNLHAAGFAVRNQSASGVGTALSSNTTNTSDASGLFSNPAVMSFFKAMTYTIGLNITQAQVDMKNVEAQYLTKRGLISSDLVSSRLEGYDPNEVVSLTSSTKKDELSTTSTIPSIYFIQPLTKNLHWGLSFTVPWATNTEYDSSWAGRYYALKTSLVTYNLGTFVSYRLSNAFSFGIGPSIQMADGELSSVTDWSLAQVKFDKPIVPNAWKNPDAAVAYKGNSTSYGFVAGLSLKPTDELLIGLSYRSEIKHKTKGKLTFEAITDEAKAYDNIEGFNQDASLELSSPSVSSLGLSYMMTPQITTYLNITHTQWNVLEKLIIEPETNDPSITLLKYENSMYQAVGLSYALNSTMSFRFGYAQEEGVATDSYRTPRTPDSDRNIIALGYGHNIGNMKLDFGLEHYTFKAAKLDLKFEENSEFDVNKGRGILKADIQTSAMVFMFGFSHSV